MSSTQAVQSDAGIIPAGSATTFAEHVARINASDAFFEALASQPDEGPIINLNFICCRPRGNPTTYEAYGAVAGPEITNVGGSIAHYSNGITGLDAAFHTSDKWDVVDLPVYPRRASYLQLQKSEAYQLAIPDRVGGTFERLLYVLSDDEPYFGGTTSIAELHETKQPLPSADGEVWVSELLRFNSDGDAEGIRAYAGTLQSILEGIGGKVVLSVRAEMPIVSEQFWDHFLLTRYPSLEVFENMLKSDDWQAAYNQRTAAVEAVLAVAGKPVQLPAQ